VSLTGAHMPVTPKQIRFGAFLLDTQCDQLRRDGIGIRLQGQPVQILEMLLERPGELVTRDEIQQRLWSSHTFVDFDHGLNTAVKKLRHVLEDDADAPRYIETVPKHGYRFIGEISRDGSKAESVPMGTDSDDIVATIAGRLAFAAISAEEKWKALRRWSVLALSALGLLVIGILIYWATKPPPMPRVVGSHALTNGGHAKERAILTDGRFVYFQELRGTDWVTMDVSTDGGEASQIPNAKGHLKDISPDATQLLFMRYDKPTTLWTMSLPNGTPRLLAKDASTWGVWEAEARGVVFSRNNDTELYRVNTDGTDLRRLAVVPGVSFLHRSPTGSRLRFAVAPSFDLAELNFDGTNFHRPLPGFKTVTGGSWSPDEKYYFFSAWDGERQAVWAVREPKHFWNRRRPTAAKLTFGPMSVTAPIVSKDGRHLFASAGERRGELSVYDPAAKQFVPYLGGISVCYVDFSRDGQWITYVAYPEGTLWRSKLDGSERTQLTLPPLAVMNPRWSPDGKLIAFTEVSNGDRRQMGVDTPPRVYVVNAEGGGPLLVASGKDPTWSPDGNSIAYDAGEIRILDLKTGNTTKVDGSDKFRSPRWSPDGNHIMALHEPTRRLMVLDVPQKSWRELAGGDFAWNCWSQNGKFIYAQDGLELVRVSLSGRRETITNVAGLSTTAFALDRWGPVWLASVSNGWFGITPDGWPITTLDKGVAEIYRFDLEYE
jgi:DNA-binding winged helix-turn-helix (wHTH) protein/Tol biopolymer transport system component